MTIVPIKALIVESDKSTVKATTVAEEKLEIRKSSI